MKYRALRLWIQLPVIMMVSLIATMPLAARVDTFYVSALGDNSDGLSWATAMQTIQEGVDLAATAGDVVIITNGTSVLTSEIAIGKAITLRSHTKQPATVLIDGNDGTRCFNLTASATLSGFTITNGSAISGAGVTMTAGTVTNCVIVGNSSTSQDGGGVYIKGSGTLVGCVVRDNSAVRDGGGIFQFAGSPVISNCFFSGNSAVHGGGLYLKTGGVIVDSRFTSNSATANPSGGGIYMANGVVSGCSFNRNTGSQAAAVSMSGGTLSACTFVSNTATLDGALQMTGGTVADSVFTNNTAFRNGSAVNMTAGLVRDCSFIGNSAVSGGALQVSGSSAVISNCMIVANSATASGGGIAIGNNGGNVINCTIASNCSSDTGGGISMTAGFVSYCQVYGNANSNLDGGGISMMGSGGTVRNCLIVGNSSNRRGGGINMGGGSVEGCTVVRNEAKVNGGGIYGGWPVTNTICMFNSANSGSNHYASVKFSHSCTAPDPGGIANTMLNPLFMDAGSGFGSNKTTLGNYQLSRLSPCRDTGFDADWTQTAVDLAGNARKDGPHVDMGAYEFMAIITGTIIIIH